ncbi:zinc finger CCHC-type containing 10 [Aspergillus ibericus CBS 121593]|uniref:Zinc knuckle-domain-containing protein n=1 Tax=Aspergillus ibericus CBS 121593 TaxID=1448316 RepID=A0A395GXN1_9EURO|nr:hypothetical protein BO80DRAFT_357202 [Aspergillus ibericus CBS 121593]RAL00286.1 hypothetical protein BO80DRAFT_357202 [Aspergillus ibericus CBS 121593]
MNRYRNAPGLRGPTKATPSTLCQKCLKRDTYECTVTAQERPYMSRPSRTQQLQNPKLRPQLSADVPSDSSRTKGLATEILAKREEERGRKREFEEADPLDNRSQMSKRARSASSDSASSVATISTTRSRSRSPPGRGDYGARNSHDRTRSVSSHPPGQRKRRYSDASSHNSAVSYSSGERGTRSRSREWQGDRNTRRRRRESSPEERGRPRHLSRDRERRDRSRSRSVDQSRVARARRSVTPERLPESNYPGPKDPSRSHASNLGEDRRGQGRPPARRERSLSPYSKRLALTQAMNLGN